MIYMKAKKFWPQGTLSFIYSYSKVNKKDIKHLAWPTEKIKHFPVPDTCTDIIQNRSIHGKTRFSWNNHSIQKSILKQESFHYLTQHIPIVSCSVLNQMWYDFDLPQPTVTKASQAPMEEYSSMHGDTKMHVCLCTSMHMCTLRSHILILSITRKNKFYGPLYWD